MAETRTFTDVASAFTTALAALTGVALILSIIHEILYYWIIGIEFIELLSVSDFIKRSIYWGPIAILIIIPFIQNIPSDNHQYITTAQFLVVYFLSILCFLAAAIDFLTYGLESLEWLPLILSFSLLFPLVVTLSAKQTRYSHVIRKYQTLILLGITLIALSVGMGLGEAYRDLRKMTSVFDFKLSENDQPHRVVILRLIERGALIRRPEAKTVEFVPWDKIEAISVARDVGPSRSGYEELRIWLAKRARRIRDRLGWRGAGLRRLKPCVFQYEPDRVCVSVRTGSRKLPLPPLLSVSVEDTGPTVQCLGACSDLNPVSLYWQLSAKSADESLWVTPPQI